MSETPGQVFEALLKEWEQDEWQIHGEWGVGVNTDIEPRRLEWRRRFDEAEARFVEALTE